MSYVDAAGIQEVSKDELQIIGDSVGAWQQEEEVLLDQILGGKPPDPAPLPPAVEP